MNNIAFIICANDELLLAECQLYISQLIVPETYNVDVIVIKDAESIAEGYNRAMQSTDAKYKVYLHQDVLVTNRYFISDLISVFNSDSSIGVIGMVGAEQLGHNGIMWDVPRVGDFYGYDEASNEDKLSIRRVDNDYKEVQVVDGLLIATQYDIPWREDILDGWDFYDVSQCIEFKRNGYKVVVTKQNPNWVIHKCGNPSLWDYDRNRLKILEEYKGEF